MSETTALVCDHVFKNERQVKVVIHHADGVWQLVCGGSDHKTDCSNFEVIGLEHLIERQPNLISLSDIERGWMAEWTPSGWVSAVHDD